jgi:hypothetical protein
MSHARGYETRQADLEQPPISYWDTCWDTIMRIIAIKNDTVSAAIDLVGRLDGFEPPISPHARRVQPPAFARRAADADRAFINFDELTRSAPSVSKAMLRIFQKRVVGAAAPGHGGAGISGEPALHSGGRVGAAAADREPADAPGVG